MTVDVEAIWEALFERLRATPGFVTYSRRRRGWGLEALPALLVLDDAGDETEVDSDDRARDGLPPVLRLRGEILVLVEVGAEELHPTTKLNGLVRAVREVLARQEDDAVDTMRHWTTLGGLIYSLEVGRVEKGAGPVSKQAAARMEITMETL